MARGWESKSVESQIESADKARHARVINRPDPEAVKLQYKRDSLLMSRTRVLHDLQAACNARYRAQLEAALSYLDQELAKIGEARRASA
jgi:hypothetical protein